MSNENENVIIQLSTFLIDAFRMRNHLVQSNWIPNALVSTYIYIGNTDVSMRPNGWRSVCVHI